MNRGRDDNGNENGNDESRAGSHEAYYCFGEPTLARRRYRGHHSN
ncbi:hypothetical protein [Natronobiforma cellulositropha]|nr:hypothetical protein [Natronobiforma cellulositropha]